MTVFRRCRFGPVAGGSMTHCRCMFSLPVNRVDRVPRPAGWSVFVRSATPAGGLSARGAVDDCVVGTGASACRAGGEKAGLLR